MGRQCTNIYNSLYRSPNSNTSLFTKISFNNYSRFQLVTHRRMAIHMPHIIQAKKLLRRLSSNGRSTSTSTDIPKGYFVVYVGEQEMKRFVVPVSLLRQPSFLELLRQSEEEFGYNHPMGGLTIPCSEDVFTELASRLVAL